MIDSSFHSNTEETGSDDASLSSTKTDLTDKLEKVLDTKKLNQMRNMGYCEANVSCDFAQSMLNELAEVMSLNNESSHLIFCDHKFVRNVEKAFNALTLCINDENIVIDKVATLSQ